ncbi:hypothetical protein RJ55_04377 [Drechmeria coniospora]|nr:hypothetical protein RJ55_04377 [Drechmeria coniospora]
MRSFAPRQLAAKGDDTSACCRRVLDCPYPVAVAEAGRNSSCKRRVTGRPPYDGNCSDGLCKRGVVVVVVVVVVVDDLRMKETDAGAGPSSLSMAHTSWRDDSRAICDTTRQPSSQPWLLLGQRPPSHDGHVRHARWRWKLDMDMDNALDKLP